ncbi:DJ-1/PfpI family protein [Actinomycetes bacterium KLBMP 9797]
MRNNRAMGSRHRIAVLALDHVVALDLGTPSQVFWAAQGRYEVRTCTPTGGPVRSAAGFQILPEHGLEAVTAAQTVVVPGIHDGPPMTDGTVDPAVAAALRAAHARGARIVSICTGAFVLAAAGLLDDRRATTHWAHADTFQALYPRVKLDPDVLFVDDGDVLTSAGVAAGIDLCLHIVRSDHGAELANRAARRCVVPPWREGGQAQYIERPVPAAGATGTAPTRIWALDRLDQPLTLAALAGHARMSVRTFTRRFREETGVSPARWLLQHRTDRARTLLETTGLGVDQVARQAGFGTAAALRQQFHAALGVSPTRYRQTFHA